jgi:hypothetical protein
MSRRLLAHLSRGLLALRVNDAFETEDGRTQEYCPNIDQTGTFLCFWSDAIFSP